MAITQEFNGDILVDGNVSSDTISGGSAGGKFLADRAQRDNKPEEYAEYNAYCEECKAQAKREVYKEV